MKQSSAALLVVGLLIGYVAMIAIGIAVLQQRSELASIETRLGSSPATSSVATSSSSPVAISTSSPSTSPASGPQIQKVTDVAGHLWISRNPPILPAKSGTTFTLTAFATDPLKRPLEYLFFSGNQPNQTVVCNWGGATCSWTAQGTLNETVNLGVAVRDNEAIHRLPVGQCSQADSCDDVWILFFQIG